MKKVYWPYFDPEFDKLPERLYGPPCSVFIDNESLEDCTVVKVDIVKKQGLLLEVVEILADLNLFICKCYFSSDAGTWFMDVFHVKDKHGNKLTDINVINYIKQAICAARLNSPNKTATSSPCAEPPGDHVADAIVITTAADRSSLLSEISAALTDIGCSVIEARAWSHNARLACCVPCISDSATPRGFEGRTSTTPFICINNKATSSSVRIERCDEKEYSIVSVECRDRPRLMFDTVFTLITHLNYLIFHASFTSNHGFALQEYFIRHVDGKALRTESDKEKIIKCLEAAIQVQRRVCKGIRVEVLAENRVGLLSDITRALREKGVAVAGFYVRHVSGNNYNNKLVDNNMELVDESMKKEPILVHLQVITSYIININASPEIIIRPTHERSLSHNLKSHIRRFSHKLFTS